MDVKALVGTNMVLEVLTVLALSVGAFLIGAAKKAFEAGAQKTAEEAATIAVKNMNWPRELAQELQKTRGVERQELRFKSYGALWAKLRPLAIYDSAVFDELSAAACSKELSDWYFSACGGLMLTVHVRDFYFALQDLLREIADLRDWKAERPPDDPRTIFTALLQDKKLAGAQATLAYFDAREWPANAPSIAKKWRDDVKRLAKAWSSLTPRDRFAVLQQAGSVLRTSMVNDVESRLA